MNMGITSPLDHALSLALGVSGVTLQELVQVYGVLANQGQKVTPYFIKKIVDRTGNVFEETKAQPEQVIDPRIAYIATHVMQDVVTMGTGTRVRSIGRPVAAKTGTTNDTRDAWFIGMTPSLIAGVWVGLTRKRLWDRRKSAEERRLPSGSTSWKRHCRIHRWSHFPFRKALSLKKSIPKRENPPDLRKKEPMKPSFRELHRAAAWVMK